MTLGSRTSSRVVDIHVHELEEDRRRRLVQLLVVALERHFREDGLVSAPALTLPPALCLYTAHGDDDEAPRE